jgi:hypothetical protein
MNIVMNAWKGRNEVLIKYLSLVAQYNHYLINTIKPSKSRGTTKPASQRISIVKVHLKQFER